MASLEPKIRRGGDKKLMMNTLPVAWRIKSENRKTWTKEMYPRPVVRKEAIAMVRRLGGDVGNPLHVFGCYKMQFGQFREMTYKWILENDPGYAAWLIIGMGKDARVDTRTEDKKDFKHYVMDLMPDGFGEELVQRKKELDRQNNRPNLQAGPRRSQTTTKTPSPATNTKTSEDCSVRKQLPVTSTGLRQSPATVKKPSPVTVTTASLGPMPGSGATCGSWSDDEDLLLAAAEEMEQSMITGTGKQTARAVPVISSRNVVPTVAAQQSAMLSGASVQKKLSSSQTPKHTSLSSPQTQKQISLPASKIRKQQSLPIDQTLTNPMLPAIQTQTLPSQETSLEVFKFTKPLPDQQTCLDTEDITLVCEVNKGGRHASWFYNGGELEAGDRIKIHSSELHHKLVIKPKSDEDEDNYQGRFSVVLDDLRSTCDVIVKEVFRFIKSLPVRKKVLEKEDITLVCKVNQTEKFARWFYGEQELDNLGRISIIPAGQWQRLIIREARQDDEDLSKYEGRFTVVVDDLRSTCDVYIKDLCLPERWKTNLPRADREWVAKALFTPKQKKGAELKKESESQLWWYPPQPTAGFNYQPVVERYFARPLLLWMPRKQWKFLFYCPIPACNRRELASSGLNQKVRHVIDIDGYYSMACEQLQCASCGKRFLTWSHELLSQLDIGHRMQFPCILTAKHACDMKVVRLLRNRGLGNSCTQIHKKLVEEHAEKWDQVFLQYLTDCESFAYAAQQNSLPKPVFSDPPNKKEKLPLPRWLMQIYIQDVLHRLDEIKASITSVTGKVLKLDSTRKVAKKLSGEAKDTALWSTNIGNEDGQVLMSVLTTGEGHALDDMIVGIIQRYRLAGRDAPKVLYVDRDCCDNNSPLHTALQKAGWDTLVRLDIWHFMRRIANGCTTESHQLYSSFMGYLSNCLFIWNEEDLKKLIESKRAELEKQGETVKKEEEVMKRLSRYELALHCRRKTRGAAETEKLIDQLIEAYKGVKGRDTLGVPLINTSRMHSLWKSAKRHLECIQDPPTVELYGKLGTIDKAGVELVNWRCARGSTSLESFHLHLNRFIPGTVARPALYQAYLLDGLHRWNEDRARESEAAASKLKAKLTVKIPQSYSGMVRNEVNTLGRKLLSWQKYPNYQKPNKYTGELIGVEYLFRQTGMTMEDFKQALETLETPPEDRRARVEDNIINQTGDDDDMLDQLPVEIDDPTISTEGLNEKESGVVLEPPTVQALPQEAKQQKSSVGLRQQEPPQETQQQDQAQAPAATPTKPVMLRIPDAEEYMAMLDFPSSQSNSGSVPTVSTTQQVPIAVIDEQIPIAVVEEPVPLDADKAVGGDVGVDLGDEECVDVEGRPGYDKAHELAAYLISVRDQLSLNNAHANHIINLWKNLHAVDKKPLKFQEYFPTEDKGCFRKQKGVRNVVPGVEYTKRLMSGGERSEVSHSPKAIRYMEAIFLQLLAGRSGRPGPAVMDWAHREYNKIVELVMTNRLILDNSGIQLPKTSRHMITDWHTRYGKGGTKRLLEQGMDFTPPPVSTTEGFLPPREPSKLNTGTAEPHVFSRPPNTAGSAKQLKRKRKAQPLTSTPIQAFSVQQIHLAQPPTSTPVQACSTTLLPSAQPVQIAPRTAVPIIPQPSQQDDVPYSTMRWRARQQLPGAREKRPYKKPKPPQCSRCKQELKHGQNHKSYYRNWFCFINPHMPYEEWEDMMTKKGYGKKQKK